MAALSERKIEIVRTIVEAAPDKVVGGLQAALAETTPGSALAGVRRLVENEASQRRLRNCVLQPLAPLCKGEGKDPSVLTFPARVLPLIWRGLTELNPRGVEAARKEFDDYLPDESPPEIFDLLVRQAAEAFSAREPAAFAQAAELCDAARPRSTEQLLVCLQISPVVRRATLRLPEWLARFNDSSAAAARLAYKDSVAISDDAGPWFFEMLAAQMAHPWMILRVICEVMDKPTERYLADSEMAFFGERVLAEIDEALKAIARVDLDGGPGAGRAAGKRVELITEQLSEMETCVDLSRDHGWGARVHKQRLSLASVVEGRLKDAQKFAHEALPIQTSRIGRVRRDVPRLSSPPDPKMVGRALTLLHFTEEIRTSANYGGFASARAKMLEALGAYIDHHVEELLDLIKTGDAENEEHAYAYLEVAANLNFLVQGEKAAALVRRRASALLHPEPPMASFG